MTAIVSDLRDLGTGLVSRVLRLIAMARRTTPAVALVRFLVAGCLTGAAALALPPDVTLSRRFLVAVALAAASAIFPRAHLVTASLLSVTAMWLIMTTRGYVPLEAWRVLTLAALLYLAHAAATLAAVLPHDCAVAPWSLARWAGRTVGVTVVGLGVGFGGLVLAGEVRTAPNVIGPIVGALIGAAIVGVLTWLLRRR